MNIKNLKIPFGISRFFWHLFFWICYITFFTIVNGMAKGDFLITFMELLIYLPIRIAGSYYSAYIILGYLFDKKYLKTILLFSASILFFTSLQYCIFYFITRHLFYPEYYNQDFLNLTRLLKGLVNVYFAILIFTTIKLVKQWYFNQQTNQKLIQEKLEAELMFLRSQIHPHFLFNTLNNLYALTLKKSDEAPEVVLKLSDLLNYMLYECNLSQTKLSKEIELIQNYIELEKLRYGQRLKINLKVTGNPMSIQVSPLLILPFIENAFKHGASKSTENTWINLEIFIFEAHLQIIVHNSKELDLNTDKKIYKDGIGLKNVKRRLELIYPNKYELEISNLPNSFYVCLDLELG